MQIRYVSTGEEFAGFSAPFPDDGGGWWTDAIQTATRVAASLALAAAVAGAQAMAARGADDGVAVAPPVEDAWTAPALVAVAPISFAPWLFEQPEMAFALFEDDSAALPTPARVASATVPPWTFEQPEIAFVAVDDDGFVLALPPRTIVVAFPPWGHDTPEIGTPGTIAISGDEWFAPAPPLIPPCVPSPWSWEQFEQGADLAPPIAVAAAGLRLVPNDGRLSLTPNDGRLFLTPNDGQLPLTPNDGRLFLTPDQ